MDPQGITLTQAGIVCFFVTLYGLGMLLVDKFRGE